MRPIRWLSAGLCLLFAAQSSAQGHGFASGFDVQSGLESLYRINLATGAAVRVGAFGFRDVDGLAFDRDGRLYGAADGSSESGGISDLLIRIDTTTGAGSLVVPLTGLAGLGPGLGGQLDYGLAIGCDGKAWLSSDTLGHVWEVDRSSGSVRRVIESGPLLSGLAARGPFLFGVSIAPDEALYRIDTRSLAIERVGGLNLDNRIYDVGLDFDAEGRLWATLDYLVPPDGAPVVFRNDLAELDPASGRVLRRIPISGAGTGINTVQMEGLAIAPPECSNFEAGAPPASSTPQVVPAGDWPTWLLIALALGGLGLLRLRHQH
ncbi:MAG: hypothetical protein MEQ07_10155 [Aquimonas sp.]|nr:hypothetical protein [Aquimonas sp.]